MTCSKKKLIISLIGLIMLKSIESALVLDLRLNSTSQQLTKDSNYLYLDTYINSCLARPDSCVNGFTVAFNLSIVYQSTNAAQQMDSSFNNGRIVLASSGGDSSFSNGGFYLHQVNIRGENYLEFGVSSRNQLYSTKLYLDGQYSTRLAFSWNRQALYVYIDGIFLRVVDKPVQRVYQTLNYNPVKTFKSLINKPGMTSIQSAVFNDTVLDAQDAVIRGNKNDFYLGCFTPKDEKKILINNALTGALNLDDQCKQACFNSSNQVYLIQKDRCACVATLQEVNSQLGSCSDSIWLAYTASHLNFGSIYRVIGLKVQPSRSPNETIEAGDSLGFSVSFADNTNYKVSFEFGSGQAFSVVGSGFVFDEYLTPGLSYVNITAVSLSDSLTYLTEKNRIEFKVGKRIDRLPMSSVNLDVQQSGEKSIDIIVNAFGGHVYQCVLDYGDYSKKEGFSSSGRNTTFKKKYNYNQTGLYVVSVGCKTESVASELGQSTYVYLPNRQAYQVNDNYELANLKETIIAKPTNFDADFDLEIPIQGVTNNLKFTVVDLLNTGANSTFDWLSPKRLPNGNNLVIRAKNKFLRNLNGDNYLAVKFQNVYLASYLISVEEPITVKPSIKLVNNQQILKLNDPIKFEVSIQMVANAFVRIDFGDGQSVFYQTSQLTASDLTASSNVYTFTVTNTFKKAQEYTVKLFMANQVSRADASLYLFFDADLPELQLNVPSELSDITQNVVLKLTAQSGSPTLIPNIKISLDSKDPSNVKIFKNYTFDASNGYSLVLTYQYSSFGVYYIQVEASNSHSTQELKGQVKIGSKINDANGRIVSGQYANVNEDVTFFVKINGGNGYQIQLNLDDSNSMILPWSFIRSRGNLTTSVPSNSVTPRARFANNGIYLMYKYEKAGEYAASLNISNSFGSIYFTFCSKIVIAQEKTSNEFVCPVSSNLILSLNEEELNPNKPYILGKSITNKFVVNYVSCNQSSNETDLNVFNSELNIYWIINSLVYRDSELSEETLSKYCFNKETSNSFELKPNELIYGDFVVKIYAFNVNAPSKYVLLGNYVIKVGASPLNNGLQGPYSVELNWNERLNLNFYQKSFDPDDLNEGQKGMKFDFICVNDAVIYADLLKVTQQKAKENDFDAKALGYNLAYQSTEYNVNLYEKNCMVNQWTPESGIENPIRIAKENMQLQIDAQALFLNFTTFKKPFIFQMILSKANRVSLSKQIKVFLNISSMAVIVPSTNLDEMENQLAQLDNLVEKDPKKALSMLGSFADAINERSNVNAQANMSNTTTAAIVDAENQKLTGLRGRMLGTVDKIVNAVDDPDSFLTAADMTASVTSNADQMPAANQESGANVMASMGAKLLQVGPEGAAMISNVAESMLGTVGNVFGAACGSTPTVELDLSQIDLLETKNDTEPEPEPLPAKIAAPLEFYEVESEEFPEDKYEAILDEEWEEEEKNVAIREKTSEIAKKSFEGISNAGGAIANNSATNGTTKVEKKGMAIVAAKKSFNESDDGDTDFGTDSGPSIKMPSLSKVIKDGSAPASVATKMLVSASNPFQSSSPDKQAKGTIVSMELTDENGNPLSINGTDAPFVIQVPNQEPARAYKSSVDLIGFTYYKLYLPSDSSSLHFVLKPDNIGDVYHVYISKYTLDTPSDQKYPNEKYNDFSFTLPNARSDVDELSDLRYTAFIGNNETKGNGTYYIGVKLAVLSEETKLYKKQHMNDSHAIQVNFTVRLFTTACKYWHANSSEWRTDGCFVADTTTFETTVCNCYHLTTFGSDMYVPPNTIDFGTVFTKFNLSDNAAVFSTVVTILGLYVFVAMYARYKDKRDIIKWGATPLSDNLPTDTYYYLISVQTGFGRDCGTKSKIGFVLSGENADSGVRKLTDDKRKAFKAGSICNFLMSVEEPLGPLTHLRIWHDNSGKGSAKSWYLNVVSILDLQNNEKSNFVCNKWFAVEKDDGQIDRVIPVACKNDMTTFKHLFSQSVKKKFTDNHLWFSVFSRPTRSNFTRLQRISTCMSLLFCTMIANAMFYKADSPNSGKQAIQVGPIKFTLSQLFTSIISTMIVVPVNVIIVTLFRKAKVVHHGIMPVKASHVAKQRHWRQNIQSIEFESSQSHFNAAETPDREQIDLMRNKKRFTGLLNIFSKNKTVEYKRESRQDELNRKRGRTLPHWVIYISWTLCFISTIVPAFFVILYSMQWGKERSNAWLTSIGLSFFQSLLVVDPLKVFIVTALITFIMRKPQEENDDSPVDSGDPFVNAIVNKDEEYLHQNAGALSQIDIREILHSRRAKLARLQPIDPEELERQRIERLKNIRMKEFLKEGSIYLAYLLVVLFLAHQGRTKNSNLVHTDLTKTFLENENQIFTEIQSRDDFWNYMESTFLPGLYAPTWYNNKSLVWREKLTSLNRQAIRVGAARLRQLRVKDNTCKVHPRVNHMINTCRASYNWVDDDTKDYDVGWKPLKNVTVKPKGRKKNKNDCNSAWCYQNTIRTKSVPIKGTYTTYKGGGYVAVLGRSIDKSLVLVDELKNHEWVDSLTRAVFFEFTLYNPNVNLFSSCLFIVEFLSTGAATTYHSISVFSLYNYLGSMGVVVIAFQIVYIAFLVYFIIHAVLQIKEHGCGYFKSFWNINDFLMIILSIIAIAMYFMRTIFTNLAIKAVHESELNGFVNFNTIALWDEVYNAIAATIVFSATLKFLKLLRFDKRIGMLAATVRYSLKDLTSFAVQFAIFIFAFTQFGYLVFGDFIWSYRDFFTTLGSMFRFSLGQYEFNELIAAHFTLGTIYFIGFIFIVLMGLMSMFVSILTEAFEKVKEELADKPNEHEIFGLIASSIKKISKKHRFKEKLSKLNKSVISVNDETLNVMIKQGQEAHNAAKFSENVNYY